MNALCNASAMEAGIPSGAAGRDRNAPVETPGTLQDLPP